MVSGRTRDFEGKHDHPKSFFGILLAISVLSRREIEPGLNTGETKAELHTGLVGTSQTTTQHQRPLASGSLMIQECRLFQR